MKRRVKIYWNLHKKCFSVQYKGIVIAHKDTVCLENVEFKVSEAGRQRVLRESRKNVHATVHGYLVDSLELDVDKLRKVSYNPYKNETFVVGEEKISHAASAYLYSVDNALLIKLKV